jgi:hypothetical protein
MPVSLSINQMYYILCHLIHLAERYCPINTGSFLNTWLSKSEHCRVGGISRHAAMVLSPVL